MECNVHIEGKFHALIRLFDSDLLIVYHSPRPLLLCTSLDASWILDVPYVYGHKIA
jgi:hypothetical protein